LGYAAPFAGAPLARRDLVVLLVETVEAELIRYEAVGVSVNFGATTVETLGVCAVNLRYAGGAEESYAQVTCDLVL
tara:strand:+ start:676 stop:903 length:228 start_codon:yes stop_codon:yes gene_type:complete